jgi:hypothetical protein
MTLEGRVREAKERLHRSIAQRARWALHDFRRDLRALEEQARLLYGIRALTSYGEQRGFKVPKDGEVRVEVWGGGGAGTVGPQDVVVGGRKVRLKPGPDGSIHYRLWSGEGR